MMMKYTTNFMRLWNEGATIILLPCVFSNFKKMPSIGFMVVIIPFPF
jgi:hypothetical protein